MFIKIKNCKNRQKSHRLPLSRHTLKLYRLSMQSLRRQLIDKLLAAMIRINSHGIRMGTKNCLVYGNSYQAQNSHFYLGLLTDRREARSGTAPTRDIILTTNWNSTMILSSRTRFFIVFWCSILIRVCQWNGIRRASVLISRKLWSVFVILSLLSKIILPSGRWRKAVKIKHIETAASRKRCSCRYEDLYCIKCNKY